jgi:tetratricopeptide (TPR) repeat protein
MSHASTESSSSSHYFRFQELLKKLQDLMAAGEGDSPAGDSVRDEMDALWPQLTEEEGRRLRGLSADLYALSGEEIPRTTTSQKTRDELPLRIKEAFEGERFDEVLDLLRFRPEFLPGHAVAYLRGRCWLELDDFLPAAWFFDLAASLEPGHPSYAAMALNALTMGGRFDEAVERAHRAAADSSSSSVLLMTAAQALFTAAKHVSEEKARTLYERVIETVTAALARQSPTDRLVNLPGLRSAGRLCRAMAHERLGNVGEAGREYDGLLKDDPTDTRSWLIAGLFDLGRDPRRADERFEQAIRGGTSSPWPYLFLGHSCLLARDYKRVVELAQHGLNFAQTNSERAILFEWLGIAQAELSAPVDLVKYLFDAAVTLDPVNMNIRRNREAFEQAIGAGALASSAAFDSPPMPDIDQAREAVEAQQARSSVAAMGLAA